MVAQALKNQAPRLLPRETYMAAIQNSVGSKMFRNIYMRIGGRKKDITENGNLSCAFYVSSVLVIMKLLKEVHATVNGTIKDMKGNGWKEIKKPKTGAVLVWENADFTDNKHNHIGFFIGGGKAVSNHYKKGYPVVHNFKFDGKRKIEHIYWHPALD